MAELSGALQTAGAAGKEGGGEMKQKKETKKKQKPNQKRHEWRQMSCRFHQFREGPDKICAEPETKKKTQAEKKNETTQEEEEEEEEQRKWSDLL